ncbi:Leucine-rich repeat-containing protein 49 [Myotis brandtii]|uniref:Leucine-rich repeat-containing protein 49 n=1 Tax=Myotis brandtii TaxID=109478 RepID=S7PHM0_MYOBR|nr:Leucine-rich repeat-containing protein 49 [Myotis brandtii]
MAASSSFFAVWAPVRRSPQNPGNLAPATRPLLRIHQYANRSLQEHRDHINLVSSSVSSFHILQRSSEEKILYSDRLTLERQKLTVCPVIDGEEHLRLLNFQHNFITRIQNISNLRRLIFLDLYDNHIEEISGLSTLRSLRVLLLGKNRIKKISNLENLKSLDVLDLHGNQIAKIENVNHLCDLRVLNLARNLLSHVDNLNGLDSLTELNLRHNQITFVRDVDNLPCLQRLFLSFNNISKIKTKTKQNQQRNWLSLPPASHCFPLTAQPLAAVVLRPDSPAASIPPLFLFKVGCFTCCQGTQP